MRSRLVRSPPLCHTGPPGEAPKLGSKHKEQSTCLRVYIAVKRHKDHGNSHKGKHLAGAGLQFQRFIHYGDVVKHGGIQADMVLEKELRVLHLDSGNRKWL